MENTLIAQIKFKRVWPKCPFHCEQSKTFFKLENSASVEKLFHKAKSRYSKMSIQHASLFFYHLVYTARKFKFQ